MVNKKINIDADKVWETISQKKKLKVSDLVRITKIDTKNIYLALGWLAKEEKIYFESESGVHLLQKRHPNLQE